METNGVNNGKLGPVALNAQKADKAKVAPSDIEAKAPSQLPPEQQGSAVNKVSDKLKVPAGEAEIRAEKVEQAKEAIKSGTLVTTASADTVAVRLIEESMALIGQVKDK